jgi:4-alpha-glucanotransferase
MGLMRLWVVPQGGSPAEGAFLNYPINDLLHLLALESHRHQAVVVGEDLGTVPAKFRACLRDAGVAGMDVLWFQTHEQQFQSPATWRDDALAKTTTHDLPTVAGWWSGTDIPERAQLGVASDDEAADRTRDRKALWSALVNEGVAAGRPPAAAEVDTAADAALAFVARSPSPLMIAPLEDLLARTEQPNMPGTVDEHPNWRRLPHAADAMLDDPAVVARLNRLRQNRT